MKNTLRIVLLLIGAGFLIYGLYHLLLAQGQTPELQRQLFAMLGLGALFLIAGLSMRKR